MNFSFILHMPPPKILHHRINLITQNFGSFKRLIVYVRMAWMTTFSKISFPAWDKNFTFQLLIRLQILSFTNYKSDENFTYHSWQPQRFIEAINRLNTRDSSNAVVACNTCILTENMDVLSLFINCQALSRVSNIYKRLPHSKVVAL